MAHAHHTQTLPEPSPALRQHFDLFLAGIGQGFNAYLELASRRAELARLDALSDADLAARGLSRADIPRHVFRDLLGF